MVNEIINDGRKRAFVASDVIMLIVTGDKKSNLMLENARRDLVFITSDFALYEALSSITKEELKMDLLSRFLESVSVVPSPKLMINIERINHLRKVCKFQKMF